MQAKIAARAKCDSQKIYHAVPVNRYSAMYPLECRDNRALNVRLKGHSGRPNVAEIR
jgi:hypothetical protein